jgi:D-xylose 1-dehydrogenase (NADP+, D-xylono-1,5-lactone-forming)
VSDRLAWGILSTGNIARQFATGVRASRSGILAAVGSRGATSARDFAAAFGIPSAYGDYQSVLDDRGVAVVYNALPNSMHHEWTVKALRAGKHVLCEKPIASSASEAEEMFEVAQRNGRVLMEAFMYRSHPQTLAVVEAVRGGMIGELRLIRTSFCFRTTKIDGNIRFSRKLAGGALMDIGCYCVNFSRLFAGGEPTDMTVTGKLHRSGVDELAAGTMTFANGVVASFTCGMTLHADNTAYLCGSDGFIEIPVPWKPPKENGGFTVARSTPPRMDSAGKLAPTPPPRERVVVNVNADLYGIEADDFAECVAGRKKPTVTREDSVGNMKVLDAMREKLGVIP